MKLTIIGTGHLASAIAKLYRDFYASNSFELQILTHSNKRIVSLYDTPIEFFSTSTLEAAEIILLAIPADKVIPWATEYKNYLRNKILIDCSNKIGNGKKLHNLLQDIQCSVIKSFTAINVFHITDAKYSITEASKEMLLASSSEESLRKVSTLVKNLGFIPKKIPSIQASEIMEAANFTNFNKWHYPLALSTITWLFFEIYSVVERNILEGHPWYEQSIQNINAAFACNALTLFGLVYGGGALAQIKQDILGRALTIETDKNLVGFLNRRKQLGLVGMYNLSAHVTISLLLFGSTYYQYFSEESGDSTILTNTAALSLFCGVMGYSAFSLISLTSLPSIAKELGMTEWRTIQSYVGWSALMLATGHLLAMSYQNLLSTTESNETIPSLFLLSVLTPCFAVVTKVASLFTNCICRFTTPKPSVEITLIEEEKLISTTNQASSKNINSEGYAKYGTFRNQKPTEKIIEKSNNIYGFP